MSLNQGYQEFLEQILSLEVEQRKNNRIQTLIRQSKLPQKVTFDDYLDSHLPPKLQKQIKELQKLQFIDRKENLILLGNPGVGKTHLAMVDRIAHRAHVLDLSGKSFRVEDTKKWLN
ncbi:ATP-binding protein [Enterococcus faecalis]